ncbi:MAG: tyrosine-type recombinase/integrase [Actinobacteria bacterium]|nr:tyrosine-type recombinase/integrase [Actinomycetota bacterium]
MMDAPTRELVADWLVDYRARGTRGSYRRAVDQFATWHDGDLLTVSRRDVRRWIAHLTSSGVTDATVRAKASALSSFYRHLVAEGLIASNPCEDVHRPQGESAPRLGLTGDQARRLIAHAEAEGALAAATVWMMAGVGLRVEEACTALIEDLDRSEDGTPTLLTVRVKGGHRVTKPLSGHVTDAIIRATRARATGPILHRDGHALRSWAAQKLIRRLGAEVGIDDLHPHILRHTAATLALEAGAPLEDVSALLGHRRLETTLRYIQNRDISGATRAAADRLAAALKPTPGGDQ